jgi:RNA polymerase sigma factor (sigma-70 family)
MTPAVRTIPGRSTARRAKAGENPPSCDSSWVDPDEAPETHQSGAGPGSLAPAHDERELVAAILRRDRKAAAQLVAANVDAVYSYVRHRLAPCADLADDLVQDVFLAALTGLASFQGTSSLRAWILGIARHKVEDFYRQRLRASEPLEELEATGGEPVAGDPPAEELIDGARLRAKTRSILAQLPERYSLMLLWRYWEQRSIREIAAAAGTTEKGVERVLARARARFKKHWIEG